MLSTLMYSHFQFSSWHLAISLTYLPAWIIVTLIWRAHVFTKTNVGFLLVLHILLGLVLASYSIFIAVPFGKSPQLAAVVSTFLAILFTIMGLVVKAGPSGVLFVLSLLFPPSFYMFALTALTGYENRELRTNLLKGDPDKGVVMFPILIAAIVRKYTACGNLPFLIVFSDRRLPVAIFGSCLGKVLVRRSYPKKVQILAL
jgi:ATP-binding cassette subfamily A (ABC1) protein 3